ncbi:FG-GAP-like repeat-containing protein [Nonomuraea sp. NPDC049480]|uniref:FG-GAP-like repeat-containing protein n=1 Tax=Nonomuraea sp. NPDC049480 TaxID=3364353 RepID=UPI0037AADC89
MPRRVMIWLALTLLLAGCGDEPRPEPRTASRPPTASTPTASTPAPVPATTPRASEGDRRRADDVDGDGRADLVVEVDLPRRDLRYLAIVHGSSRGLDQGTRTIVSPDTFFSWLIDVGIRADFDGDGFGDILGYGRPGGRDERMRPHIFWGGPRGIEARAVPTPVPLPVESDVAAYRAVAGDFNGDGAADVAMSSPPAGGQSDTNLAVLYGPFNRQGVPSRQSVQPSPTGAEFWRMTVDRIDGRRATGLIVYEGDDGQQTSGWLLTAGPGGLSKAGRKLNAGMSAAFGDFDGDDARDVAVGDDGGRNDEPGYETEPPSVDRTLTVYYGSGRTEVFRGTAGPAVSGDFDGDGRDDLAFGGANRSPARPVRIFWGGSGGLRAGGGIDGVSRAAPLAAGDYDGDGDDELAFVHGGDSFGIIVTDGRRVLARFGLPA